MKHKRSLIITGHKTSISLEKPFWEALQEIAAKEQLSIAALVERLDCQRTLDPKADNLSSYLRVYILNCYRTTPALLVR
ncbi:MAG: ribbon-helix-helix domain-containing protein [Alphaproteobacteria bacterium]